MRTIFVCVDDMGAHFVCRRWCTQRLRVGNSRRVPTSCILAARLIVCLRATRPTDADVEDSSEEDSADEEDSSDDEDSSDEETGSSEEDESSEEEESSGDEAEDVAPELRKSRRLRGLGVEQDDKDDEEEEDDDDDNDDNKDEQDAINARLAKTIAHVRRSHGKKDLMRVTIPPACGVCANSARIAVSASHAVVRSLCRRSCGSVLDSSAVLCS